MTATRVAAIDCGTNSLRLLIADIDAERHELTDVLRRMEIVRLGQGVDATGRLAEAALGRTFAVLAEYARAVAEARASVVRMVATSATRDASNADEFTRRVVDVLGVTPEVISGEEEAYLSFIGATAELGGPASEGKESGSPAGAPGLSAAPPYLVVDIGGGSTEFVLGRTAPDLPQAISVDVGSVRLTERYLLDDPPHGAQVRAAAEAIDVALAAAEQKVGVRAARTLVGVAGSVTTVTAIALGLAVYDPVRTHHARLSAVAVHEVTGRLLSMTRAQRAGIRALHPGRVDVIGAGALIMDRIMERFGFAEMVTSEHDILDGIAWSLANRPATADL